MTPPDIFDRHARRRLLERAQSSAADNRWLIARMAGEIVARLETVRRPFTRALIMGMRDEQIEARLRSMGVPYVCAALNSNPTDAGLYVQCDEDRLPFADASFDLVISIGTLDTVTDVPGALMLIRRILKPDGLFLGAMIGFDSLPLLKSILQAIEPEVSRTHPLIEVRSAGDLLARAGFSMPVADLDAVTVRYAKLKTLITDLRSNGLSNCLATRPRMKRNWLDQAMTRFDESDRTETFSIIFLSGWGPVASEAVQTSASRSPIRGRSAGGMSIE